MKKKLLAIITTLAMAIAFAVPAFAAGTITKGEQALLDKFSAGVNGIKPPAGYVSAARNVLLNDDFSADELAKLEATMDKAFAEIKASGATSLSEVKKLSNFKSIVADIQAGCAEVGYKVTLGAGGTVTVTDPNGKVVSVSPRTKQTGFDMTATVVSALALVGVLSAGAVVISKKELLAD